MHSITGFNPELCGTHNVDCKDSMYECYNLYRPNTSVRSVMARRKVRKHTSSLLKLQFNFATVSNPLSTTNYGVIDLAQCLSLASRRFYRQGMAYNVVGFKVISDSDTGTGRIDVSTVPTTWVASGAWQKSFVMWNRMNDQALDIDPSIKPKFHDFKFYLDEEHLDLQTAPGESDGNTFPLESGYAATGSEWLYSKIQIPNDAAPGNTDQHVLHMCGPEIASVSMPMIHGYEESRAVPFSPDPELNNPSVGWMNQLFNVGDNLPEITNVLEDDNDELPYDQHDYPGGAVLAPYAQVAAECIVTPTTIGAESYMNGCLAYGGLLKVTNTLTGAENNSGFNLIVYLAPGRYKGIDAIPMQDVN